MTSFLRFLSALAVASLVFAPVSLQALTDAEAETGRALVKRYADTVVLVEMVVTFKVSMGDRVMPPREQKRELNGTVISASGLTVISLGDIDPRGMLGGQPNVRMEDPDFKEVKLRLADGSEVPAQIVLKDADLDLAFIRPAPDAPADRVYPYVKLEESAEPVVLGLFYNISRATKLQQRAPIVLPVTVVGLIEKPRRLYLANGYSLSCPVFDGGGKLLGLCLRNVTGGQQAGMAVVPSADIAEIAKQAAAAKVAAPAPANETPAAPPSAEKAP